MNQQQTDPQQHFQNVRNFMVNIVTKRAQKNGRKDVMGGINQTHLQNATASYAKFLTQGETPLALFLDARHKGGRRGMLLTDRFLYSSYFPVPLPVDRVRTVDVDTGAVIIQKLNINGVCALRHGEIDSFAVDLLQTLANELTRHNIHKQLIGDPGGRIGIITHRQCVEIAARDVAEGKSSAEVVGDLRAMNMPPDLAKTLADGLLHMIDPGNRMIGVTMMLVGFSLSVLSLMLMVAPEEMGMEFIHPIFGVLMLLGCVFIFGKGIVTLRSVGKKKRDPAGLMKTWMTFLDAG